MDVSSTQTSKSQNLNKQKMLTTRILVLNIKILTNGLYLEYKQFSVPNTIRA
jgi:hypothetical protein